MSCYISNDRCRVYVQYDGSGPPHPGEAWTRFVCISDTHGRKFPLPAGDVLLHAGDLSAWGYPDQLEKALKWIRSLNYPLKVIIGGNHDMSLDPSADYDLSHNYDVDPEELVAVREKLKDPALRDSKIFYLENEAVRISTGSGRPWRIYGCPASPAHRAQGAFQYSGSEEANEVFQKIPDDVEILLTHTPPYNTLDKTKKGKHAGCRTLESRINDLKSLRLHVFGHIHEAFGARTGPGGHIAVNAALPLTPYATIVDLKH